MNNQTKNTPLIEVVIDSVQSAIAAKEGGAARVELCDNLFEGGTTPSAGMIKMIREYVDITLNVMIRPRGGDFLYSDLEFEVMKEDIRIAKEMGANGLVFGILNADGSVDKTRNGDLLALAHPLPCTFHRAFDVTNDPFQALEEIISLGFRRILTSGQENSALEGIDLLKGLVSRSRDRIIIMPGGGINDRNIKKISGFTKAKEFHLSGRSKFQSKMSFHRSHVYMGGTLRPDEYSISIADSNKISQAVNELN